MEELLPYDIAGLFNGAVRVLYAPISATVATKIDDVVDMVSPYAVNGDWVDFGAAKSAPSYSRGLAKEGATIQQESGNVLEEVSDVPRQVKLSIAEITPENLMILENASEIETVAAGVNIGAQQTVGLNSFDELTEYRMAFVGARKKKSVLVTEPGGATRGGLLALLANRVTAAAETSTIEFDRGNLAEAVITFDLHPEPGETEEVYGRWATENAGTILAA